MIPSKSLNEPFEKRLDFSEAERDAIRHYRDKNYEQYHWSLKPKVERENTDCDIMNGCLRKEIRYRELQDDEKTRYLSLVRGLHSAIKKSRTNEELIVYKGVKPFDKLKNYHTGAVILDNGFSSFSTSLQIAREYAGINEQGELIIFVLSIGKEKNVLYIDALEDEWLIQNRSKYGVVGIEHVTNEKFGKAILYNLILI